MLTHSLLVSYWDLPVLVRGKALCGIEISRSLLVNLCRYIPIICSPFVLTCNYYLVYNINNGAVLNAKFQN